MTKLYRLGDIQPGMVTSEDIFVPGSRLVIVHKDTVLTERVIRVIGYHHIYQIKIKMEGEKPAPMTELPEIAPVLDDELKQEAVGGIRKMFDCVSAGDSDEQLTTAFQAVKELDTVVDRLVDTLTRESGALVHISDLKSYDEYTYHHSLSVAVLSIAIGQSIAMPDADLRLIGRCAMMHDIGKMLIPPDIINKPAKLTNEEFALVKKHTEYGYNYLKKGGMGDDAITLSVLCHHEKLDGSGYPGGLTQEKIPYFARVISVADVYDAVTSYRSYRSPMAPADALELIMSDVGRAFDYDIVKYFIKKIDIYPINTCVELNNGRRGIVIDNSRPMRPILLMMDDGNELDLFDLNNLSLIITRVIDR